MMSKLCRHLLLGVALLAHPSCAVDFHAAQRSRSVVVTSEGDAEPQQNPLPILGVKHVSKAGGSFMINIANQMTQSFKKEGTRHFFPKYFSEYPRRQENFVRQRHALWVVSSMRNPCDWYVSQWAFAEQFDKNVLPPKLANEFFGDSNNATKFAKWLWWAQGMRGATSLDQFERQHRGPHFGVLSLRVWESFISGRSDFPRTPGNAGYDTTKLDAFSRTYLGNREVLKGLGNFTQETAANCWVHVESYYPDLRACLQQYERVTGAKLDWAPFEREAKASAEREEGKVSHNDSEHKSCEDYYTPELKAMVEKLDKPIFDAFGYRTCCGKSTSAK